MELTFLLLYLILLNLEFNLKQNKKEISFKGGLSLKFKNLNTRLYFIATKYLWNNSLVEHIDNWTRSYSL